MLIDRTTPQHYHRLRYFLEQQNYCDSFFLTWSTLAVAKAVCGRPLCLDVAQRCNCCNFLRSVSWNVLSKHFAKCLYSFTAYAYVYLQHIEYIYKKKLIKYSSIFYKLRNKLPSSCLRSIYYAFIHPHILYGIEIYVNTFSTYLKPLNVLNNKLLRIFLNCRLQTPVAHLYWEYQTLPLSAVFCPMASLHLHWLHLEFWPVLGGHLQFFVTNIAFLRLQ